MKKFSKKWKVQNNCKKQVKPSFTNYQPRRLSQSQKNQMMVLFFKNKLFESLKHHFTKSKNVLPLEWEFKIGIEVTLNANKSRK